MRLVVERYRHSANLAAGKEAGASASQVKLESKAAPQVPTEALQQLEVETKVMLKYLSRVEEILEGQNAGGKIGAVRHSLRLIDTDVDCRCKRGIIVVWLGSRRSTARRSGSW